MNSLSTFRPIGEVARALVEKLSAERAKNRLDTTGKTTGRFKTHDCHGAVAVGDEKPLRWVIGHKKPDATGAPIGDTAQEWLSSIATPPPGLSGTTRRSLPPSPLRQSPEIGRAHV